MDVMEVEVQSSFNVSFAKFASSSPIKKKEMLKQRSNEHYKKHVKEKKEYLDRNIT
jgi:hypothetical protein